MAALPVQFLKLVTEVRQIIQYDPQVAHTPSAKHCGTLRLQYRKATTSLVQHRFGYVVHEAIYAVGRRSVYHRLTLIRRTA